MSTPRGTPSALVKARYGATAALAAASLVTGGVYVHLQCDATTSERSAATSGDTTGSASSSSGAASSADSSGSASSAQDLGAAGDTLGSTTGSAQTMTQGS